MVIRWKRSFYFMDLRVPYHGKHDLAKGFIEDVINLGMTEAQVQDKLCPSPQLPKNKIK